MTRLSGIIAACVAVLASLLLVPAAQAGPLLTPAVERAILAGHHPYLHRVCGDELVVGQRALPLRAGRQRLIVAQVTCAGATSGTPIDTGLYDARGHQRYLIDRGRPIERGAYSILAVAMKAGAGNRVVVRYDGYLPKDAMCCPSRLYARTFRLRPHHYTAGALRRVS